MTVVAIVQARMGSSRLPGKVMKPLAGAPLIDLMLARLDKAHTLDKVVVATTDQPSDDRLAAHLEKSGRHVFRGSQNDVLNRFVGAAKAHAADVVIRLTGDCPLIDAEIVDSMVEQFRKSGVDYLSNIDPPTYPDGFDTEIFTANALFRADREAQSAYEREHVTPYLRTSPTFTRRNVAHQRDLSAMRLTVDEAADLAVVTGIVDALAPNKHFGLDAIEALSLSRPDIFNRNNTITRNQGATMTQGQKLWKRAKQIIPGGGMLLSKRAEMFLPEQWPAYFSRSKGCTVWDLDGRELTDMSLMGIGTNVLGYGQPEVDEAVSKVIQSGNMSTLNAPEEVWVAEKLIEIAPFADMVRFTRSGGEANAVAIRIARAATGRDNIAVCGYHGWHDWYLSANLGTDDSLAGHLLPGLDPAGVPKALRGVVHPFNYNDLATLEHIVNTQNLAAIKMEVVRNAEPRDGFLQKVRDLATKNGIVLIFDECTSGFRETYGGLYLKYGVDPDMAVFGKTMGNGYAINAVAGRREVMEAAQASFISSTFWTERIGSAAALKALEVMARERSWERITDTGRKIMAIWQQLADHHKLTIQHAGLPALATFSFASPNHLAYRTLMTQEMLKKGWLAATGTYACLAHTPEVLARYTEALDPVFGLIAQCENGRDVMSLLEGPICHAGFRRIN